MPGSKVTESRRQEVYELAEKRLKRLFGRTPPTDWTRRWRAEYEREMERERAARRLAYEYRKREPEHLLEKVRKFLQLQGADPYARLPPQESMRRRARLSPTARELFYHVRAWRTRMPFSLEALKRDPDRIAGPANTANFLPFIVSRFWNLPTEPDERGWTRFRHLSNGELAAICVVVDKNFLRVTSDHSPHDLLADLRRRVARTRKTLHLPRLDPELRRGRPLLPYP